MLVRTTAPASPVVSLAEAKAHLVIDENDTWSDDLLSRLIATATQKLDGRDGLLGRALITQSWRLALDRFDVEIVLPLGPVQSVDGVTFVAMFDGSTVALDAADYQVTGIGSAEPARIAPAFGKAWPAPRRQREAVAITFTAGYGDGPEDVPEPIRNAILMHVAHMWQHREIVPEAKLSTVLPFGYADLITDYRTWAF